MDVISLLKLYVKIDKREGIKKMRMLAVLCVFVIATNQLHFIRGVEGANIRFSSTGATKKTYATFIDALRAQLKGTTLSHNIPVMRQSVPDSQRFIQVDLANYDGQAITLAIDVLNAYVVGYLVNVTTFYYFPDSTVPIDTLFPNIKDKARQKLPFTGSYIALENAAGKKRDQIPLGASPLDISITSLLTNDIPSRAKSLIIIIQMVSEVARFKGLQSVIGALMDDHEKTFTPEAATLSVENNWSALSKQIQLANKDGQFQQSVQLRDRANKVVEVKDVATAIAKTGIALLLYQSGAKEFDHVEPIVSFLIGYNDLCMEANNDNSRVLLENCALDGRQPRQKWALYGDGTIRVNSDRSMCVTSINGQSLRDVIIIRKCQGWSSQRWEFKTDDTISNPNSVLVMDVKQ